MKLHNLVFVSGITLSFIVSSAQPPSSFGNDLKLSAAGASYDDKSKTSQVISSQDDSNKDKKRSVPLVLPCEPFPMCAD